MSNTTFEMQVWDASRRLWRHALRLAHNDVDRAEDLLSEAVISALTARTRPNHDVQPWLYGVLRHRFLDEKRKGYTSLKDTENGPRLIFTDDVPDNRQDICTPEAILMVNQGLQRALAMQKVPKSKACTRFHASAKLTDADVIYIRGVGRDRPTKYLMAQFGVGFDAINRIKKGLSYTHVPMPEQVGAA